MRNILLLLLFLKFSSCSNAQDKKTQQHIAVCRQGYGCQIIEIKSTATGVDKVLGKTGFWANAADSATLIIENCTSKIETKLSLSQIHQFYGGKGAPKKLDSFDLQKYLKDKGCFACPNTTKKISFYVSASGADGHSGNSYFFLNLKAGEAFMPNEAFQQLYGAEAKGIIVDQFIRNGAMEIFTVAEGNKYRTTMALGTTMSVIQNDAINEQRFKTGFKKTGNTRKHLNTTKTETEYSGKDDEGKTISFWTTPIDDVCLAKGKFDAFGFYNLGYISVDGITYLVSEISGSGFQIKLTGIAEHSYNFNPAGYKTY